MLICQQDGETTVQRQRRTGAVWCRRQSMSLGPISLKWHPWMKVSSDCQQMEARNLRETWGQWHKLMRMKGSAKQRAQGWEPKVGSWWNISMEKKWKWSTEGVRCQHCPQRKGISLEGIVWKWMKKWLQQGTYEDVQGRREERATCAATQEGPSQRSDISQCSRRINVTCTGTDLWPITWRKSDLLLNIIHAKGAEMSNSFT